MARKVADFAVRIANRLLKLIRKGPVTWDGQTSSGSAPARAPLPPDV